MMEVASGIVLQAFADISSGGAPIPTVLNFTDIDGNFYLPSAGDVLVIHNLTLSATTAVVGVRLFHNLKAGTNVTLATFTLAAGQPVSMPTGSGAVLVTPALLSGGNGLSIDPPANSRIIVQVSGILLSRNPQFLGF